ncbi:hypothetical protein [Xenorhabdus koppenhoeferi]|nr:hypothetical protein [Xenorhabdus sp. Vera]
MSIGDLAIVDELAKNDNSRPEKLQILKTIGEQLIAENEKINL